MPRGTTPLLMVVPRARKSLTDCDHMREQRTASLGRSGWFWQAKTCRVDVFPTLRGHPTSSDDDPKRGSWGAVAPTNSSSSSTKREENLYLWCGANKLTSLFLGKKVGGLPHILSSLGWGENHRQWHWSSCWRWRVSCRQKNRCASFRVGNGAKIDVKSAWWKTISFLSE